MPLYEYRCRSCGDTFERLRPQADADEPADCACDRSDTVRLPSLIARGAGGGAELPMAGGAGAGCCGGGCCG
jgi:putative FmdB family regulatory protein